MKVGVSINFANQSGRFSLYEHPLSGGGGTLTYTTWVLQIRHDSPLKQYCIFSGDSESASSRLQLGEFRSQMSFKNPGQLGAQK